MGSGGCQLVFAAQNLNFHFEAIGVGTYVGATLSTLAIIGYLRRLVNRFTKFLDFVGEIEPRLARVEAELERHLYNHRKIVAAYAAPKKPNLRKQGPRDDSSQRNREQS